jgi:hypothetical protein|tara:strand:- start:422 stop:598 length:177 start_codon:yes stop_codon:yes gene_type:complete
LLLRAKIHHPEKTPFFGDDDSKLEKDNIPASSEARSSVFWIGARFDIPFGSHHFFNPT